MKLLMFMIIFTSLLFEFHFKIDKIKPNQQRKHQRNKTTISKFPHIVGLFLDMKKMDGEEEEGYTILCYGSIVHKYWALTPGMCVNNEIFRMFFINGYLFVRGNTTFPRETNRYGIDHKVVYIHVHNDSQKEGDHVALLKVEPPFKGIYEKPVRFNPPKVMYKNNASAISVGWPYWMNQDGIQPEPRLSFENVYMIDINKCEFMVTSQVRQGGFGSYRSYIICVSRSPNLCPGIDGTPLVKNNFLLGMALSTLHCEPKLPAFYIKTSMYEKWISTVIKKGIA